MNSLHKKILIIDDVDDFRESLVFEFEERGFRVTGVSSAEEGIEQIEKFAYDLVISDFKMPGMDGVEFLKMLKRFHQLFLLF